MTTMYELITNISNYTEFLTGDGHAITAQNHDTQVLLIIIIALLLWQITHDIAQEAHRRRK